MINGESQTSDTPESAGAVAQYIGALLSVAPETVALLLSGAGYLFFILMLLSIYLAPTIIACELRKRNIRLVFLINHFFGWTVLGWTVAYFLAFFGKREEREQDQDEAVNQTDVPMDEAIDPETPQGYDLPTKEETAEPRRFLSCLRHPQSNRQGTGELRGIRAFFAKIRLLKSPWYYWYMREYRVVFKTWIAGFMIATIPLVAMYMLNGYTTWRIFLLVMIGFLLEMSLLGIILLLAMLYFMAPDWVLDWTPDRLISWVIDQIFPLIAGAVFGLIVGRILACYFSQKQTRQAAKRNPKNHHQPGQMDD